MTEPLPLKANVCDRMGTVASSACAAHCILCSLAPGLLAVLGISWLTGHTAEWGFTLVAICFACVAIAVGRRAHSSPRAVALLGMGAAALLLGRVVEALGLHSIGTGVGLVASAVLVAGHVLGIRASRTRPAEPYSTKFRARVRAPPR